MFKTCIDTKNSYGVFFAVDRQDFLIEDVVYVSWRI